MELPSKDELERLKLAQDIRFERIKLYLSVLGALVVVLGLLADRLKTHEQHRHEFELVQFNQKLSRMTAIAEEYDRLLAQTTAVLDKNRSRTWLLINELRSFEEDLRDAKVKGPDVARMRQYLHDVNSKLAANSKVSVDEWADALALQARWDTLSRSPTPDFEQYFEQRTLSAWASVRKAALTALEAEYTLAGKEPTEKKKSFVEAGTTFQTQIYGQIRSARTRM